MPPKISIVAAIDESRGIGKDNRLLWHISEDLKRFRHLTFGHPIIMGRKTYESIGKLLPGRINIIVTRDPHYVIEGALMAGSVLDAINKATQKDPHEIFLIGGGQIYTEGIRYADTLYLTCVQGTYGADTFFPEYTDLFEVVSKSPIYMHNHISYQYIEMKKKRHV